MTRAERKALHAREHRAMVRRILKQWHAASAADLESGLAWYARAEGHAAAMAAGTPYTPRQCAAVIAALSPRMHWRANLDAATTLVEYATHATEGEYPRVGLGSSVAKAAAILAGAEPEEALGARPDSAPKVRAFFANITGDLDAVTVDVWAARAALGRDVDFFPDAQYHRIAKAYRSAARKLEIAPRDLQAAVWVHIRGNAN